MTQHRIAETYCPNCGLLVDGAHNANPYETERPRPGDVGICFACTAILAYNEDLTVRAMTSEEIKSLPYNMKEILNIASKSVRENIKEIDAILKKEGKYKT